MIEVERSFAADHPSAAGHFPGHPVIPGAVLLDEVVHVLHKFLGNEQATLEVRTAKFLHPVLPGERISIIIETIAQTEYKFECKLRRRTAVAGTLRYTGPAGPQQAPFTPQRPGTV